MDRLRVLTKSGLKSFSSWIEEAKVDGSAIPPTDILQDDEASELYEPSVEVSQIEASTRLEVGLALLEQLKTVSRKDRVHNVGLWSWLSLYNIDLIAPLANGKRNIGDDNRLIFDPKDFGGYYRHLLRAPWWAMDFYQKEPEICRGVLSAKPHIGSEVWEQIGSARRRLYAPAVLHAVNTLYYDDEKQAMKPGYTNRNGSRARGTLRRLVYHCNQLDLTHLFRKSDKNALLDLLPKKEYAKWLEA